MDAELQRKVVRTIAHHVSLNGTADGARGVVQALDSAGIEHGDVFYFIAEDDHDGMLVRKVHVEVRLPLPQTWINVTVTA